MHGRQCEPPASWPPDDVVAGIRNSAGGRQASVGLVLGSGLGSVAESLEAPVILEASGIPGYPVSRVAGHAGRLILGRLGGRDAWVVQGRVHLYEGHTPEVVTRQVRLLHALGVRTIVLTNAAGSLDRGTAGPGELLAASDAISLFFRPLVPPGERMMHPDPREEPAGSSRCIRSSSGSVWRSHGSVVDPELHQLAQRIALAAGIPLRLGVLAGSLGPNYETASEVRAWRRIGGTVASMSTVPEAIEARRLGMRCLLFSLVTNHATGIGTELLTHEDVVDMAAEAGGRLARLLTLLVPRLP